MKSTEAIKEAKNQIGVIINKLKKIKTTLEDPSSGFLFGTISRSDDMYGIGFKNKYVCFNWCRPYEYDINNAMLITSLFERQGIWEFDMKEIPKKIVEYKYSRDIDGKDGWMDFRTERNFITTNDLVDKWIEEFLIYIDADVT